MKTVKTMIADLAEEVRNNDSLHLFALAGNREKFVLALEGDLAEMATSLYTVMIEDRKLYNAVNDAVNAAAGIYELMDKKEKEENKE